MRSRYSAYVLGLESYLMQTWHPDYRPAKLGLADEVPAKWLGLEIKCHKSNDEANAIVEFIARYKLRGKAYRLHEISRFSMLDGRWLYLDGELKS